MQLNDFVTCMLERVLEKITRAQLFNSYAHVMSRRTLPTGMLNDFIISLPALLAGIAADIVMFGRVNESAWYSLSC